MLHHQQRVVDELASLDVKLLALENFFGTPTYVGLPADERERLHRQALYMIQYRGVLKERIHAFNSPT